MNYQTQFRLGASMYVPGTQSRRNLVSIGNGEKYPFLRSVIFCLEDAVSIENLEQAIYNIRKMLPLLEKGSGPLRFIRVRNPEVLGRVLRMKGIENIDGFVLPKLTADNMPYYLAQLTEKDDFWLMPTLETQEAREPKEMVRLRTLLMKNDWIRSHILCLRIGGNDLLNLTRLRRDPECTIYETEVGDVIKRLVGEFIPYGFGLTGAVFESDRHPEVLAREVVEDLRKGLYGKTAIHPSQITIIENLYRVRANDLAEAQAILAANAPAVFKMNGRMCEVATHKNWAEDILLRYEIYGVRD